MNSRAQLPLQVRKQCIRTYSGFVGLLKEGFVRMEQHACSGESDYGYNQNKHFWAKAVCANQGLQRRAALLSNSLRA